MNVQLNELPEKKRNSSVEVNILLPQSFPTRAFRGFPAGPLESEMRGKMLVFSVFACENHLGEYNNHVIKHRSCDRICYVILYSLTQVSSSQPHNSNLITR